MNYIDFIFEYGQTYKVSYADHADYWHTKEDFEQVVKNNTLQFVNPALTNTGEFLYEYTDAFGVVRVLFELEHDWGLDSIETESRFKVLNIIKSDIIEIIEYKEK